MAELFELAELKSVQSVNIKTESFKIFQNILGYISVVAVSRVMFVLVEYSDGIIGACVVCLDERNMRLNIVL